MKQIIISLFIPFLFVNCAGVYIPPSPQIPLFREANEFNSDIGFSANSAYLNAGYSLNEEIAVIANVNVSYRNFTPYYDLSSAFINDQDVSGDNEYIHHGAEFAIGRYWSKPNSLWVQEVFVGAGFGASEYETYNENKFNENDYVSGHVSYDIGYVRKYFSYGFGLKLFHTSINAKYKEQGLEELSVISLFGGQLGAKIRLGKDRVFFQLSGALNISTPQGEKGGPGFSNSDWSNELVRNFIDSSFESGGQTRLSPHSPIHISLGVSIRL